jgi:hypothetical protein
MVLSHIGYVEKLHVLLAYISLVPHWLCREVTCSLAYINRPIGTLYCVIQYTTFLSTIGSQGYSINTYFYWFIINPMISTSLGKSDSIHVNLNKTKE